MHGSNGDDSFRAYLTAGTENINEVLVSDSPFLSMMDDLDDFLRQHVCSSTYVQDNPIIHSVRINARFLLMTGFRVGLTGHSTGVFPILRTALETACYALVMSKKESLCEVWINRNSSPEDTNKCKNAFSAAIKSAQKIVSEHQPELGHWMYALYESTIDFGAHPNAKTVTLHTRILENEEGYIRIENVGLYGVENHGYLCTLLACVEMGLVTAFVLALSAGELSDEANQALHGLNMQKEALEDLIRKKFP